MPPVLAGRATTDGELPFCGYTHVGVKYTNRIIRMMRMPPGSMIRMMMMMMMMMQNRMLHPNYRNYVMIILLAFHPLSLVLGVLCKTDDP